MLLKRKRSKISDELLGEKRAAVEDREGAKGSIEVRGVWEEDQQDEDDSNGITENDTAVTRWPLRPDRFANRTRSFPTASRGASLSLCAQRKAV